MTDNTIAFPSSLTPTASAISITGTVNPINQFYTCNASNISAKDRLALLKNGNKGNYGTEFVQLFMMNVQIPNFPSNIIQPSSKENKVVTDGSKSMIITEQVYTQTDTVLGIENEFNTFKLFTTKFIFQFDLGTQAIISQRNAYIAFKIYDPSTCTVPTLIPPTGVILTDSTGNTFNPVSVSGTTGNWTVGTPTAQIYWFPTLSTNTYNDSGSWILVTLPVTNYTPVSSPTPVSLTITLRTLLPIISLTNDRSAFLI